MQQQLIVAGSGMRWMLELVVLLLLMVEVLLLLLTFDVHWNYFGFAVVSSRACKKGETFQLFLFASMQIAVHPPLPLPPWKFTTASAVRCVRPWARKTMSLRDFAFAVCIFAHCMWQCPLRVPISSCSKFVVSQLLK